MFLPALTVALAHLADPDPQPPRRLARGARIGLRDDGTLEGTVGASRARAATPCATPPISTVSVLGVNIGFLVGGTLVIEQVFAVPGVGQLMINSIFQRDFPVVQAVTLVFSLLVVLVYLLTDVAHALLDPRVRFD